MLLILKYYWPSLTLWRWTMHVVPCWKGQPAEQLSTFVDYWLQHADLVKVCPLVMYTLYSGWRRTLLTPELCKKNNNNSTEIYINFYAPFFKEEGVYCFWPVCLSVTLSVQNFNLGLSLVITFAILNIANFIFWHACASHGAAHFEWWKVKVILQGQRYGWKIAQKGHCVSDKHISCYIFISLYFNMWLQPLLAGSNFLS